MRSLKFWPRNTSFGVYIQQTNDKEVHYFVVNEGTGASEEVERAELLVRGVTESELLWFEKKAGVQS